MFTFHEDRDGDNGGKIRRFREIVREKANSLNASRLVHLSGRELLPEFTALSIDMLHPSTEGMAVIASNLAARMSAFLR